MKVLPYVTPMQGEGWSGGEPQTHLCIQISWGFAKLQISRGPPDTPNQYLFEQAVGTALMKFSF